jgi:hypothetical protein
MGGKSYIDVVKKVCSCKLMSDKGICEHLVRVAIKEEIDLLGLYKKHRLTVRSSRIKYKKKFNLEISKDEDFENSTVDNQIEKAKIFEKIIIFTGIFCAVFRERIQSSVNAQKNIILVVFL